MKLKDLKIGMYARTKDGLIRKITYKVVYPSGGIICGIDKLYVSEEPEYHDEIIFEDIVKASFNIADIIEKGDYINGELVNNIVNGRPSHEDYNDPFYSFCWDNEDIESIVTHQQMEQMSYKVGE